MTTKDKVIGAVLAVAVIVSVHHVGSAMDSVVSGTAECKKACATAGHREYEYAGGSCFCVLPDGSTAAVELVGGSDER